MQNMFFDGWKYDHYVSNVFVFALSGFFIACSINAPGPVHDSTVAEWGEIYGRLEHSFGEHGGQCVVESSFSKHKYSYLINSSLDCLVRSNRTRESISTLARATSARKGSKWVTRSFQGSSPMIKDIFVYKYRGESKAVLLCMVLLCNLRSRIVGIN